MAAAKNAATVLALRILFGFASTFLQALTLYTSLWYKRDELATRTCMFLFIERQMLHVTYSY